MARPNRNANKEKAAHVRAQKNTDPGSHTCHWPGCPKRVAPAQWGCKLHWYMLPHTLRNRIWGAYEIGQEVSKTPSEKYIKVAKEAQDWIAGELLK